VLGTLTKKNRLKYLKTGRILTREIIMLRYDVEKVEFTTVCGNAAWAAYPASVTVSRAPTTRSGGRSRGVKVLIASRIAGAQGQTAATVLSPELRVCSRAASAPSGAAGPGTLAVTLDLFPHRVHRNPVQGAQRMSRAGRMYPRGKAISRYRRYI
jgi:hypothetical protein